MRRLALIFAIALLTLALLFIFDHSSEDETLFDVTHSRVARLLDTHEPAEAYQIFKTESTGLPENEQHLAAHVFGEALYAKGGEALFSVCDGEFGFGCFHGFTGAALAERGEGILPALDASCVEEYGLQGTGCFHGLGHGLVSYFGYEHDALERALSLCETLSWKKPMSGCSDGVFMEYNFRTMEEDPAKRYRAYSFEERLEPCASLTRYPLSCYFGLSAWWITALPESESLPKELGMHCRSVAKDTNRQACFRGIGYGIAPHVAFDPKQGAEFCDDAASDEERLWCREGLAWSLFSDPAKRSLTDQACEGLGAEESQCKRGYLFAVE